MKPAEGVHHASIAMFSRILQDLPCNPSLVSMHVFLQLVAAASDAEAIQKLDWTGMSILTYQAAFNQSDWRQQAKSARFKDPIQGGLEGIRMWGRQCNLLLSDSDIISQLKVSRYSIAITFLHVLCCRDSSA